MKYHIENLLFVSRHLFNLFLIQATAMQFLFANGSSGQSLEEVRVNLKADRTSLVELIQQIEAQTNFDFAYNEKVSKAADEISLNIQNGTLKEVLNALAEQTDYNFRRINENIYVMSRTSEAAPQVSEQSTVRIMGTITDKETGEPLIGASIQVSGMTLGTITDVDGHYTLDVPSEAEALLVSYLGYVAERVNFDASMTKVDIQLTPDAMQMDEVVVTGQGGNVSKKRLSSPIQVIKSEELENIPSTRIDQLLSAELHNAEINLTGGQAGATSVFRARGVNSGYANSTPIIYIDGVRMDNLNTGSTLGGTSSSGAGISSLADIPMDNIDHIEFINGGAATTLYGSDAANGVLQIFTKKGGSGHNDVTVEVQNGVETATNDWLYFNRTKDLLFQNGYYQKYSVNLNGGDQGFGYSISGNYQNSSGVQIFNQNQNEKMNFSSGFKASLGKKISYESSVNFVYNKYHRNRNGNQGGYTGLWVVEDGASTVKGFDTPLDSMDSEEYAEFKAYVREGERLQKNKITTNRVTTSQTFKYNPIESLTIQLTGGLDWRKNMNQVVNSDEYEEFIGSTSDNSSISNYLRDYLGITAQLNIQHRFDTENLSFITTLGSQVFRNQDHQISYTGTNIREGALTISDAGTITADEYLLEVLNYGVYFQENMGYKDRIFLDLGVRGDRNPAFGDQIGTQYYPKAGLSWMMSSEPWFNSKFINQLKLRTSYGVAGNLPPAYSNQRLVGFSSFNDQLAAYWSQAGNDDLKPEKVYTYEFGTDIALWNSRVTLSAGYYHSTTRDALFSVPLAASTGFSSSQWENVGEVVNHGFEFFAEVVPVQTQDWTFSVNASANTLYNELTSSGGADSYAINGFSARTIQTVVAQGHSIGYLRGYKGYFNADGTLDSYTAQAYLGRTIPTLFGNMGLKLRYKRFDLFANASYQKGAYANSFDAQFRYYYGVSNDHIPAAEIKANGRADWLYMTNRFVSKTDFIKVRNIGLFYSFKTAPGAFYKSLSVGVTAINPLNFAASWFDPETTISGAAQGQGTATTGGVSYSTYSAPRQFIGTVRFKF